jgi:hypothetical protein
VPALKKPERERMAQLMASGKPASVAFAAIKPKDKQPEKNCGRFLKRYPEIEQRVAEIVNLKVEESRFVGNRALEIAAVDKSYVLRNLKEIVDRCMQAHPVLDQDGAQVYVETPTGKVAPEYGFDPKPAVAALRLLGLEAGMFVQRFAQVPDPFAGLPAQVVQQIMEALAGVRAGRVIEHASSTAAALPKPAAAPRVDRRSSA